MAHCLVSTEVMDKDTQTQDRQQKQQNQHAEDTNHTKQQEEAKH